MLNLQIIGTKFKHCNELANFVVRFHDLPVGTQSIIIQYFLTWKT